MAWYAELVRKRWYCICGIDMIHEYKKKLYDDWYNSLTEEEKERLAEEKRELERVQAAKKAQEEEKAKVEEAKRKLAAKAEKRKNKK